MVAVTLPSAFTVIGYEPSELGPVIPEIKSVAVIPETGASRALKVTWMASGEEISWPQAERKAIIKMQDARCRMNDT